MARKIIVQREDGSRPAMLTEIFADDKAQLQETVKDNPDLLPVDEFGMAGPLMVVGRETTLCSGYVDLVCLSQGGDLLFVEFKTGPQNSDFRHSLAQLVDYGSYIRRMTYEEFESTVANRFSLATTAAMLVLRERLRLTKQHLRSGRISHKKNHRSKSGSQSS